MCSYYPSYELESFSYYVMTSTDLSFPSSGPSGLVQQCRPAGASVPKPPLVISDSDSEEEEGLVSRLMPASCLQQPASCTEGVSTTQNTPGSHNSAFDEHIIWVVDVQQYEGI